MPLSILNKEIKKIEKDNNLIKSLFCECVHQNGFLTNHFNLVIVFLKFLIITFP